MTEQELLKALAQALSGNQMWAILVVFGTNFALGVIRALLDKTFSWEKLPNILEKTLPIFGYAAVSVVSTATTNEPVSTTMNWGAAILAIVRYALPTLRDASMILKSLDSPLTFAKPLSLVMPELKKPEPKYKPNE